MATIREILQSKRRQKAKVSLITRLVLEEERNLEEIMGILDSGSDVEKGTCADVLKHVAQGNPEIVVCHVDTLIGYIDYKAPRVRWGVQESIGYVARRFPDKVEKAVPKLLSNTGDPSTVVRWCAAFALSEIVLNNRSLAKRLLSTLEEIAAREKNNGVRNVYLKAFRAIEK